MVHGGNTQDRDTQRIPVCRQTRQKISSSFGVIDRPAMGNAEAAPLPILRTR